MVALGSVLLHRGMSEEGAAFLPDYRVEIDYEPFGYYALCELGWACSVSMRCLDRADRPVQRW
jgi:hypothetical protein